MLLVGSRDFAAFVADRAVYLATERSLFVVGEALTHVGPETRSTHAQIPWIDIIGLRNILAHGYFGVDPAILWRTVQEDVPTLIAQLRAILGAP